MSRPTDHADVLRLPLRDNAARIRIRTDLDTNFLVEAGAGSGKTTELVNRMVALVATGVAPPAEIAAVTFTRKAAAELRERLQGGLEERIRRDEDTPEARARLQAGLEELDRAFLGTIHAFCARLLRERPLDVGLDPEFEEIPVEERAAFQRRWWDGFVERLVRDDDPVLGRLADAGLRASRLRGLFEDVVQYPDVTFPTESLQPPAAREIEEARRELDALIDEGMELMGDHPPDPTWDDLQQRIRTLHYLREVAGWEEAADFFDALERICKESTNPHKRVQKRWLDKGLAKKFFERVDAFALGPGAPGNELLERWYAYRYALALEVVGRGAREFAEHRRSTGRLDFQDLLVLAARLLRENATARQELARRYPRLLVDEFQDTDPLQAEIVFLLAAGEDAAATGRAPGEVGGSGGDGEDDEGATEEGGGAVDWRTVVPRPGALFVVGDPKQSIYRFRRADIELYEQVRDRFEEIGDVLELTTNFRSRPGIGDVVNEGFRGDDFFPEEATREQARFEPLETRPPGSPVPAEGVFWYGVPNDSRGGRMAAEDAGRIAAWIRARIDRGERRPGDFMILTRQTHQLAAYARALEARDIPVQVTGAGVGREHELEELLLVLRCLVDPGDPVKVAAVLVGLFFGLDLDRLARHRQAGGRFDVDRVRDDGEPGVRAALSVLHGWWRRSTREPADILLTRLVDELGILPYAAAGELGSLRCGALAYGLEAVRAATLAGDASLPGALDALEGALALREAEAPLEPARPDVVQLMNLHQAKGLEADVVILADPRPQYDRAPTRHVRRGGPHGGEGYLVAQEARGGFRSARVLARPRGWRAFERTERAFEAAEQVRLLYVAVTRARHELVVARVPEKPGRSAWSPLDPALERLAEELELEPEAPAARASAEMAPDEVARRVREAEERLRAAAEPTYRHVSVTEVAKAGGEGGGDRGGTPPGTPSDDGASAPAEGAGPGGGGRSHAEVDTFAAPGPGGPEPGQPPGRDPGFRGYSWGSVVHAALAAAGDASGEAHLRAVCQSLLIEFDRPVDERGEPAELEELLDLVEAVRGSDLWRRARDAGRRLVEVPFAAPGLTRAGPAESPPGEDRDEGDAGAEGGPGPGQLDLFGGGGPGAGARPPAGAATDAPRPAAADGDADPPPGDAAGADGAEADGIPSVLEGVIDLAFREEDGWVIADYKTDLGTDPAFASRREAYRRQVELYAGAWTRLTGEPVKERVLFFTSLGTIESW